MRLQEIIKENLEWHIDTDKDIFMSLKGLVNKNNGVWKSDKQRWFVMNKLVDQHDVERPRAQNEEFFGIKTNPDDGEVGGDISAGNAFWDTCRDALESDYCTGFAPFSRGLFCAGELRLSGYCVYATI